jgi:glutamate-1-semialdehyde 2,1-aminomutase
MNRIDSQSTWIERARAVLPAGGFGNFDPGIFIDRGEAARVWDVEGREYVDYLIGSGPMLLGHGHPEVMEAVFAQLPKGMTFFANNTAGVELAEEICRSVACAEQVRYVTSGGEADMYAMRAARAFTGRSKIMKFEGGYHGMSAEAQMSLAPLARVNFPEAQADSAGIPDGVRAEMLIAPFNDLEFAHSLVGERGGEIAAIIVEPLQRIIPPEPGFLEGLRGLCDAHGILLIFDEIVTGYRLDYGGAQARYRVVPDLCTLGKIVGGGFPLAAIAGRRDIMAHFDKAQVGADRWLMQLGTLSGNPVAAVAGLKTMEILRRDGQYERLRSLGRRLMDMQSAALDRAGIAHRIVGDETLFDILFLDRIVRDYRDVQGADARKNTIYNKVLREHGVFKSPGKMYPCLALTEADLDLTAHAVDQAVAALGAAE